MRKIGTSDLVPGVIQDRFVEQLDSRQMLVEQLVIGARQRG
jgi:hypothetical protein